MGQHPSAASAREASPLHFEDEPVSGLFSTNPGTWPFIKSGKRKKKNPAQGPGGAVFVLHGSNSVHPARKDSHSTFTSSEKINGSLFSAFLP